METLQALRRKALEALLEPDAAERDENIKECARRGPPFGRRKALQERTLVTK
jgi:hypothetical protein